MKVGVGQVKIESHLPYGASRCKVNVVPCAPRIRKVSATLAVSQKDVPPNSIISEPVYFFFYLYVDLN